MFSFLKPKQIKDIKIIGVAGTRGKTISARMIQYILQNVGFTTSLIDSEGFIFKNESGSNLTIHSADTKDIHQFLTKSAKDKHEFSIIEVTSKNIIARKYKNIQFDLGIITNIYDDHQDIYTTVDKYIDTKLDFIKNIKNNGKLITFENIEGIIDRYSTKIKQNIYYDTISFHDIKNAQIRPDGITFEYAEFLFNLGLMGLYNIENTVITASTLLNLIGSFDTKNLSHFTLPPGRMSSVLHNNVRYIIDMSIHPDSIEDSLRHIYETKLSSTKVITVGGSTEKYKKYRKKLAEVLTSYSDLNILTIQDIYNEDVYSINSDIINYARFSKGITIDEFYSKDNYDICDKGRISKRIDFVIDRGDKPFILFNYNDVFARVNAIDFATYYAKPGDTVYIYGKGNVPKINIGKTTYRWSDFEALEMALDE